MRNFALALTALLFASQASAQQQPQPGFQVATNPQAPPAVAPLTAAQLRTVERLRAAALEDDRAWTIVESLVTEVGPRLAGSEAEARARDWAVRMLREDLAITFGNDGAELIRRVDQQATRLARWEGGEVGALRGALLYDDSTLLLAGSRGLFAVRMNRSPLVPQRLLDGEIVALEAQGKFLFVVRPDRVEVALPKHLMMHITARRIPLGQRRRALRLPDLDLLGRRRLLRGQDTEAIAPRGRGRKRGLRGVETGARVAPVQAHQQRPLLDESPLHPRDRLDDGRHAAGDDRGVGGLDDAGHVVPGPSRAAADRVRRDRPRRRRGLR